MIKWTDPTTKNKQGRPKVFWERFAEHCEAEAEKRLVELQRAVSKVGTSGLGFSKRGQGDYFGARQILDVAGFSDLSLIEVARNFVRSNPVISRKAPPIDELLEQFLDYKANVENRRQVIVANLKRRIEAWMGQRGHPIPPEHRRGHAETHTGPQRRQCDHADQ